MLTLIVDKNYQICFDLIVKIGKLRFDEHRQLEEIAHYLKCSSAKLDLPISTIGMIAKRFLEFCQLLHQKYESQIREGIKSYGGYFLHFDGSTENKSGKINFLVIDSRSGHVLESTMIESEKKEIVKNILRQVQLRYGNPLITTPITQQSRLSD